MKEIITELTLRKSIERIKEMIEDAGEKEAKILRKKLAQWERKLEEKEAENE